MKITVCIGSSCHVKGSRQVAKRIKELVSEHMMEDRVQVAGIFCMGECRDGVCVAVDDELCSVTPDTVDEFFGNKVMAKC